MDLGLSASPRANWTVRPPPRPPLRRAIDPTAAAEERNLPVKSEGRRSRERSLEGRGATGVGWVGWTSRRSLSDR